MVAFALREADVPSLVGACEPATQLVRTGAALTIVGLKIARIATYDRDMNAGAAEELDFAAVGRFKDKTPLQTPRGLYRYERYRSFQHLDLHQRLRRGEVVRCRLAVSDGTVVQFVVTGHREYGVLSIIFSAD
jgi:hypothetical protein